MDTLVQDIRYAVRKFAASPGFTAVALLTLALGIGANSAIFSVIDGVLLRPLPFQYGDRVIHLQQPVAAAGVPNVGFSATEVADYRAQLRSADQVAEYHSMPFTLLGRPEPLRVQTGVVSADYFDMLGVQPLLGRTFRPGEDQPGATPVLVLSYDFWQREFGGDPNVVGRTFEMNDRVHTVIGVLPDLPDPDRNDVYMPISSCPFRSAPAAMHDRDHRMVEALARLKPGVTMAQAERDVKAIAAQLHADHPDAYPPDRGFGIGALRLTDELSSNARPTLLVLVATAGFVLLIACANVANLMLARQLRREREMVVRVALGAGRARLARQLLTESLLLAFAGGLLGLLVAMWTRGLLASFAARFSPRAGEIAIDARVLLFTLGVCVLVAVVLGLLPALPRRTSPGQALRQGVETASTRGQRVRGALIIAQVATACMLLIAAGLMVRSLIELQRVNPGFDPEHVLTARVDLNWTKYTDGPKIRQFEEALLDRLREGGAITAVAVSSATPLSDAPPYTLTFRIGGESEARGDQRLANIEIGSPDYFRTLGIPLVRGRTFTDADRDTANEVAVINHTAARRYWGGRDPVGSRVTFDKGKSWLPIIGVVSDVRDFGLSSEPAPTVYVPFATSTTSDLRVLVRSRADARHVEGALRAAVAELDRSQPVTDVRTLSELRRRTLATPRTTTLLLSVFAALALVITAAGLAGVIAFTVSQRTRELGIRIALGAARTNVLAMVIGQGLRLVLVGLVIGVVGAMALSRLISGLLFQVHARDPLTFMAVATLLGIVGVLACLAPARRATAVDPVVALRE